MKALIAAWALTGTIAGHGLLIGSDVVKEIEVDEATIYVVREGSAADNFLENIGKAGITLGHVVILREGRLTGPRLRHEMKHVDQWEKWGPFFWLAYPVAFRHFEKQAKEAEGGPK